MTTRRAAATGHRHTENLFGEIRRYLGHPEGREGWEQKTAYATATIALYTISDSDRWPALSHV